MWAKMAYIQRLAQATGPGVSQRDRGRRRTACRLMFAHGHPNNGAARRTPVPRGIASSNGVVDFTLKLF